MKKNKYLLLRPLVADVFYWTSQFLLVVGYFLAFAYKGMPKGELTFIFHPAFVVYFFKDMAALRYDFPEKSSGYFIKMTRIVVSNFIILFVLIYVWDGFSGF